MFFLDLINQWPQFTIHLMYNVETFAVIKNLALTCKELNQNIKNQFKYYRLICENYSKYGPLSYNEDFKIHQCNCDSNHGYNEDFNNIDYEKYYSNVKIIKLLNPLFQHPEKLYTNEYEEQMFYKILDIYRNILHIESAAKNGYYVILNWYAYNAKKKRYHLFLSNSVFDYLSYKGDIGMLNWFKKNKNVIYFNCSGNAINYASLNGDLDVLNFWYNYNINEFPYTSAAIDWASIRGHINVLDWFYEHAEESVMKNMNNELSFWNIQNKFEFKYTEDAIDDASTHGKINVLDWFFEHSYNEYLKTLKYQFYTPIVEFKFSYLAIDLAAANGHIDVLEWFFNHSLSNPDHREDQFVLYFKYKKAIDLAAINNHNNVLEWFFEKNKKYNLYLQYDDNYLIFHDHLIYT